jgi:hypothetical protein
VGKSTAIERFVEHPPHGTTPYFFATGISGGSPRRQLAAVSESVFQSLRPFPDASELFAGAPGSWRDVLARIALAAKSDPVIAVLDEFPYFAKSDPTLEGELQAAWDRTLEKLPVLFILIGSDVSMMESLATYGRPLFGRLRPLVVQPLGPGEVSAAAPNLSPREVFEAQLVTGGYPRLVTELARSGLTASAFAEQSLNDPFSPLLTTGGIILGAEFPEPTAAAEVLAAAGASGKID